MDGNQYEELRTPLPPPPSAAGEVEALRQGNDDGCNAQDQGEHTDHRVANSEDPTLHKPSWDTLAWLPEPEHGDKYDQ